MLKKTMNKRVSVHRKFFINNFLSAFSSFSLSSYVENENLNIKEFPQFAQQEGKSLHKFENETESK